MLAAFQNKSFELLDSLVESIDLGNDDDDQNSSIVLPSNLYTQAKDSDQSLHRYSQCEPQESGDAYHRHKRRNLSMDLLYVGMCMGQKGLQYVQKTRPYQLTDQYVHYGNRYQEMKAVSLVMYRLFNDKLYSPGRQYLSVIYDQTTRCISFLLRIFREHHSEVVRYVREHYANIKVKMAGAWLQLDFNQDGRVDPQDMKRALYKLLEFLMNYDYIQKVTHIRSHIYR